MLSDRAVSRGGDFLTHVTTWANTLCFPCGRETIESGLCLLNVYGSSRISVGVSACWG